MSVVKQLYYWRNELSGFGCIKYPSAIPHVARRFFVVNWCSSKFQKTKGFICTEETNECYGNMVQNCVLSRINDPIDQLDYVTCATSDLEWPRYIEEMVNFFKKPLGLYWKKNGWKPLFWILTALQQFKKYTTVYWKTTRKNVILVFFEVIVMWLEGNP